MNNTYILVHRHKYGSEARLVKCNKNLCGTWGYELEPPNEEIHDAAEAAGMDFEPHKGETIEAYFVAQPTLIEINL